MTLTTPPPSTGLAEFNYSLNRRGVENMISVVMEPSCRDTSIWQGAVGLRLGSQLYVDLAADVGTSEFDDGVQALRHEIETRMQIVAKRTPSVKQALGDGVELVSQRQPRGQPSARGAGEPAGGGAAHAHSAVSAGASEKV